MHPLGVKFVFLMVSFFNNFAKYTYDSFIYLNPFHLKSCFLFTNILYGLWFIYLRILIYLEVFFSVIHTLHCIYLVQEIRQIMLVL